MTARSIRREAERKANKLARKAAAHVVPSEAAALSEELDWLDPNECCESAHAEISPARLAANRANAQFSTGAKTSDGKSKSCLNAVKTALTGRTVLLPTDDAVEYERHLHAYEKELAPVGQLESDLAQSIADTMWRLKRIPALEMAIFAQGYVQFADQFKEHDESLRPGMIELQTFIAYEKQLRNLQLQESRLSRRREKETAELRRLQSDRKAKEAEASGRSATRSIARNGFDFSTPETDSTAARLSPDFPTASAAPLPPRGQASVINV